MVPWWSKSNSSFSEMLGLKDTSLIRKGLCLEVVLLMELADLDFLFLISWCCCNMIFTSNLSSSLMFSSFWFRRGTSSGLICFFMVPSSLMVMIFSYYYKIIFVLLSYGDHLPSTRGRSHDASLNAGLHLCDERSPGFCHKLGEVS